jgi:hypothetical protein
VFKNTKLHPKIVNTALNSGLVEMPSPQFSDLQFGLSFFDFFCQFVINITKAAVTSSSSCLDAGDN